MAGLPTTPLPVCHRWTRHRPAVVTGRTSLCPARLLALLGLVLLLSGLPHPATAFRPSAFRHRLLQLVTRSRDNKQDDPPTETEDVLSGSGSDSADAGGGRTLSPLERALFLDDDEFAPSGQFVAEGWVSAPPPPPPPAADDAAATDAGRPKIRTWADDFLNIDQSEYLGRYAAEGWVDESEPIPLTESDYLGPRNMTEDQLLTPADRVLNRLFPGLGLVDEAPDMMNAATDAPLGPAQQRTDQNGSSTGAPRPLV